MAVIFILSTLLLLGYCILIFGFYLACGNLEFGKNVKQNPLSIVVPFRNEESNLPKLLRSFENQTYPKHLWEIIFIDDHSEDKGRLIVENWIRNSNISARIISLEGKAGKKSALVEGVRAAKYSIIQQCDADCNMSNQWLEKSQNIFNAADVKAALGVVRMIPHKNICSEIFALEFLSLQASGAALCEMGLPIMANGANLMYDKDTWLNTHSADKGWASGDDVFFIQSLAKKTPASVKYNSLSIVDTMAPATVKDFIYQRIRWGSKTPAYPLKQAIWLAYFIAFFNCFLLAVLIGAFFNKAFLVIYGSMLVLKALPEWLLLNRFAKLSSQKYLLKWFPISVMLYPFYIFLSGFFIVFKNSSSYWKGRPLKI